MAYVSRRTESVETDTPSAPSTVGGYKSRRTQTEEVPFDIQVAGAEVEHERQVAQAQERNEAIAQNIQVQPEYSWGRAGGQLWAGTQDVLRMSGVGLGVVMSEKAKMINGEQWWDTLDAEQQLELYNDSRRTGKSLEELKLEGAATENERERNDRVAQITRDAGARLLQATQDAEWLKTNPEYLQSAGFWEDLLRATPQMVAQVLVGIGTAGTGNVAFMGAQIFGGTYENAIAEGFTHEQAMAKGLANSIVQAPLEAIGIGKVTKLWKPKAAIFKKLKYLGKAMGTEALTEFLQQIPEHATNLWSAESEVDLLKEFWNTLTSWEELKKWMPEGAKAAAIGAILGGGSHVSANKFDKWIRDAREGKETPPDDNTPIEDQVTPKDETDTEQEPIAPAQTADDITGKEDPFASRDRTTDEAGKEVPKESTESDEELVRDATTTDAPTGYANGVGQAEAKLAASENGIAELQAALEEDFQRQLEEKEASTGVFTIKEIEKKDTGVFEPKDPVEAPSTKRARKAKKDKEGKTPVDRALDALPEDATEEDVAQAAKTAKKTDKEGADAFNAMLNSATDVGDVMKVEGDIENKHLYKRLQEGWMEKKPEKFSRREWRMLFDKGYRMREEALGRGAKVPENWQELYAQHLVDGRTKKAEQKKKPLSEQDRDNIKFLQSMGMELTGNETSDILQDWSDDLGARGIFEEDLNLYMQELINDQMEREELAYRKARVKDNPSFKYNELNHPVIKIVDEETGKTSYADGGMIEPWSPAEPTQTQIDGIAKAFETAEDKIRERGIPLSKGERGFLTPRNTFISNQHVEDKVNFQKLIRKGQLKAIKRRLDLVELEANALQMEKNQIDHRRGMRELTIEEENHIRTFFQQIKNTVEGMARQGDFKFDSGSMLGAALEQVVIAQKRQSENKFLPKNLLLGIARQSAITQGYRDVAVFAGVKDNTLAAQMAKAGELAAMHQYNERTQSKTLGQAQQGDMDTGIEAREVDTEERGQGDEGVAPQRGLAAAEEYTEEAPPIPKREPQQFPEESDDKFAKRHSEWVQTKEEREDWLQEQFAKGKLITRRDLVNIQQTHTWRERRAAKLARERAVAQAEATMVKEKGNTIQENSKMLKRIAKKVMEAASGLEKTDTATTQPITVDIVRNNMGEGWSKSWALSIAKDLNKTERALHGKDAPLYKVKADPSYKAVETIDETLRKPAVTIIKDGKRVRVRGKGWQVEEAAQDIAEQLKLENPKAEIEVIPDPKQEGRYAISFKEKRTPPKKYVIVRISKGRRKQTSRVVIPVKEEGKTQYWIKGETGWTQVSADSGAVEDADFAAYRKHPIDLKIDRQRARINKTEQDIAKATEGTPEAKVLSKKLNAQITVLAKHQAIANKIKEAQRKPEKVIDAALQYEAVGVVTGKDLLQAKKDSNIESDAIKKQQAAIRKQYDDRIKVAKEGGAEEVVAELEMEKEEALAKYRDQLIADIAKETEPSKMARGSIWDLKHYSISKLMADINRTYREQAPTAREFYNMKQRNAAVKEAKKKGILAPRRVRRLKAQILREQAEQKNKEKAAERKAKKEAKLKAGDVQRISSVKVEKTQTGDGQASDRMHDILNKRATKGPLRFMYDIVQASPLANIFIFDTGADITKIKGRNTAQTDQINYIDSTDFRSGNALAVTGRTRDGRVDVYFPAQDILNNKLPNEIVADHEIFHAATSVTLSSLSNIDRAQIRSELNDIADSIDQLGWEMWAAGEVSKKKWSENRIHAFRVAQHQATNMGNFGRGEELLTHALTNPDVFKFLMQQRGTGTAKIHEHGLFGRMVQVILKYMKKLYPAMAGSKVEDIVAVMQKYDPNVEAMEAIIAPLIDQAAPVQEKVIADDQAVEDIITRDLSVDVYAISNLTDEQVKGQKPAPFDWKKDESIPWGEAVKLGKEGVAKAHKFANNSVLGKISVTRKFKGWGERVGRAIKKYHSVIEFEQAMTSKQIRAIVGQFHKDLRISGKKLSKKETREWMADVVLMAEDDRYAGELMARDNIRGAILSNSAWLMRQYFKNAKKWADTRSIEGFDFVKQARQRIKDRVLELQAKMVAAKSINDQDKIDKIQSKIDTQIKRWNTMRTVHFVHVPIATWFPEAAKFEKGYRQSRKAKLRGSQISEKIKATKTRNVLTIKSMIDKKMIKKEDVDPVAIMMSYGNRIGQAHALVNIRDAAIADNLAKKVKNKPRGKYFKYWEKGTENSGFEGLWVSDRVIDAARDLKGEMDSKSWAGRTWMKLVAQTKMMQFYNPVFMPVYDLYQSLFMGRGILHPVSWTKNLAKAAYHTIRKDQVWQEAMKLNTFSKPHSNPMESKKRAAALLHSSRKSTIATAALYGMQTARGLLGLKGRGAPIINEVYNLSWDLAWMGDQMIRLTTYGVNQDLGLSKQDSAELAARVHADYADVPARLRKAANKFFFTPTYMLSMLKVQTAMVENTLKWAVNLPTGGHFKQDAQGGALALGAVVSAAALIAMNELLKSAGWEEDEWGRKWTKKVGGTGRELTLNLTNPLNKNIKYWYWLRSFTSPAELNPFASMASRMKWEATPVFRIGLQLLDNRKSNGDKIYQPFDTGSEKALDTVWWTFNEVFKMTEYLGIGERGLLGDADLKQREALINDVDNVFKVMERMGLAFVGNRTTKERRIAQQIQHLIREYRRAVVDHYRSSGKDRKKYKKWEKELRRRIGLLKKELKESK